MEKVKMTKLKNCPFCQSNKIDISIKSRQQRGNPDYFQISVYCKNCHAMGPRILCKGIPIEHQTQPWWKDADYPTKEQDIEEAINKWNNRGK